MYICADIGGTSARLELFSSEALLKRGLPLFKKTYDTERVPSFIDLFRSFLEEANYAGPIHSIVCGIPGDVIRNRVSMQTVSFSFRLIEAINIAHWGLVDGEQVVEDKVASECWVLNDFECAAYSLNALTADDVKIVRMGRCDEGACKVIIGVGTGLGVSFATSSAGMFIPFPSEAGWIRFTPLTPLDEELTIFLKANNGWESLGFEQVCSGRALANIYKFFRMKDNKEVGDKTPLEICKKFNQCPDCTFAVQLVLEYLGRFISQLALVFKPAGGFFLTGGLMESLHSLIEENDSFHRGLKSQPAVILQDISDGASVYYIKVPDVGLAGARAYSIARDNNRA